MALIHVCRLGSKPWEVWFLCERGAKACFGRCRRGRAQSTMVHETLLGECRSGGKVLPEVAATGGPPTTNVAACSAACAETEQCAGFSYGIMTPSEIDCRLHGLDLSSEDLMTDPSHQGESGLL